MNTNNVVPYRLVPPITAFFLFISQKDRKDRKDFSK